MKNLCKIAGCQISASFGFEIYKPKYCAKHKEQGMINVKHNMCYSNGCNKRASFGYKNYKAEACFKHKLEHMINIKIKLCIEPDCYNYVSHALIGHKPRYCNQHKTDSMIESHKRLCQKDLCRNNAIYGHDRAKYYIKHKLDGMKNYKVKYNNCRVDVSIYIDDLSALLDN